MSKINLTLHYPTFIEKIVVYFMLRYRKKKYGYPFRLIELTQGKYAKVDAEDYEKLNIDKWYAKRCINRFYAHRRNEANINVGMHREIMKPGRGYCVDHINGDGLDNRRANLRIVTIAENNYNKRKSKNVRSSQYKGVSIDKRTNKWRAIIYYKYRKINLGHYANEIDAAKAYDEAANELFGKFARLNFSEG
jgi:hypothetical protein